MTVREYYLAYGRRVALGDSQALQEDESFVRTIRASVLCNEAALTANSRAIGDPTETALLVAAAEMDADVSRLRAEYPKIMEIPFDPATKRMITVHQASARTHLFALKGAPAVVLDACTNYLESGSNVRPLDEEPRVRFLAVNDEMAERALRVLALAEKTLEGAGDQALHARDLEGVSHDRLAEFARTANLFARVSPEDKLRIVEALVRSGEVVAVTGDGINDAPALKRASIGVAMGERGTEAAKEAADVVLADDNFATILKAVEGGRTVYANIIKFVHMMFSDNLAEVLVIFLSIAAGWPLPLLPLQILWMNLVTDVFPALALSVESAAPGVMRRPPRSPQSSLLSRGLLVLIAWQAVLLAAITLSVYAWAIDAYGEGAHARTVALMANSLRRHMSRRREHPPPFIGQEHIGVCGHRRPSDTV